jgi:CheY-like chemotaxis protein
MSALARILIVEDDPNDLELTLTALGEYNLANEVIVTRDGQEALDWIVIWTRVEFPATIEPECLVLDVRLPGLSGLELQKRMAKVDLDIPIVFITGHGDIPNSCVSSKSESSSASAALDDPRGCSAGRRHKCRPGHDGSRRNDFGTTCTTGEHRREKGPVDGTVVLGTPTPPAAAPPPCARVWLREVSISPCFRDR